MHSFAFTHNKAHYNPTVHFWALSDRGPRGLLRNEVTAVTSGVWLYYPMQLCGNF